MRIQNLSVTLINEDPMHSRLLKRYLERMSGWKFSITDYANWDEAKSNVKDVDILLFGVNQEQAHVLKAIREIRGNGDHRPIIATANLMNSETIDQFIRAGVDCYLHQGDLSPDGLKQIVEQLVYRDAGFERVGQLSNMSMTGVNSLAFNRLLLSLMDSLQIAKLNSDEPDVIESLEKAQGISREMASMLKLSAGELADVKWRELDLSQVIEEAVIQVDFSSCSNLHLNWECEPELIFRGKISMLVPVVKNLLINAIEAMPDGGNLEIVGSRIIVDEQMSANLKLDKGEYIRLKISDSGVGMSKRITNRIFEPFYTTKMSGVGKNSGLGLTVVQQNVQQHGGVIRFDSQPEVGTVFNVYLKPQ